MRTPDSTVTQSLHLMNSRQVDGRIRSDDGRAARLAASDMEPEQIVDEIYLAVYSRHPEPNELQYAVDLIESAQNRRVVVEDLMWAMINSPEFSIQN
jgi:hypothetical protein